MVQNNTETSGAALFPILCSTHCTFIRREFLSSTLASEEKVRHRCYSECNFDKAKLLKVNVMNLSNNLILGINQYSRELMCLAQGRNTVPPVGIKPRTSPF